MTLLTPLDPAALPLDAILHPGFGEVEVSCDGEVTVRPGEDATLAEIEAYVATAPNHDWRVWINAPLGDWTYQRHGEGKWVLVEKGEGFA